jgi:membrane protein required for colicin V production
LPRKAGRIVLDEEDFNGRSVTLGPHAPPPGVAQESAKEIAENSVMNSFDAAVYVVLIVAVVSGFNAGLLRSVATMIGYLAAMPVALATTPFIARAVADKFNAPVVQSSILFFAVFLVAGIVFGALLRTALGGTKIGWPDRLAGSLLGAVRIGLVAITMVLIFDRIIPSDRQPAFLRDSQLRPILLVAGRRASNPCRRRSPH